MSNKPNRHIQCNVQDCQNHCGRENFCALDSISVGSQHGDPAFCSSVDCRSYMSSDVFPETKLNCGELPPTSFNGLG